MSDRTKTLILKRAYFTGDYGSTLEGFLRSLFQRNAKARDRIIKVDLLKSLVFAGISDKTSVDGIFVRLFEFEYGGTGAINFESTNTSAGIEEVLPPKDQEFLISDIVLLVQGNNVIASGMANKNRTFSRCVCEIGAELGLLGKAVHLQIEDVPNQVTLEELHEYGVAKIDFGITDYLASLPDFRSKGAKFLETLLAQPSDLKKIRKRAATVGRVSLSRGRFRKDEIEKDEWLTEVGAEIVESDIKETYTIKLENGKVLTNSNLKLQKTVKVKRYANTVHYDQLEREMAVFQNELIRDGILVPPIK